MLASISSYAQNNSGNNKPPTGAFPEASFGGLFEKNLPPKNDFSPFDSWRANMEVIIVIYRSGNEKHEINFYNLFQTIGTEKKSRKVKVAGTVYVFGADYGFNFSENAYVKAGVRHLSSHIAEDLKSVIIDVLRRGGKVPKIDASDLNVFFVEGFYRATSLPLEPEVRLRIQPIGFNFDGTRSSYDKPVYVATLANLWKGHEKRLVFTTQHEIGKNGFNDFSIRMELYAKNQREGRFQLFFAYSPGNTLHVSTNEGQFLNGRRAGIKLNFRAR